MKNCVTVFILPFSVMRRDLAPTKIWAAVSPPSIMGGCVGKDHVGSNRLITPMDIQGRIGRLVPFLENIANGQPPNEHTVSSHCKHIMFDDLGRQPSKQRTKHFIIRVLRLNDARRRCQIAIIDQEARLVDILDKASGWSIMSRMSSEMGSC
jgi:hypothetical protein